MDELIKRAKLVLNSSLTDQEVALKCDSLTPEDIHTIRQSQTNLEVLPYIAIQELGQLGEEERQQTVLLSPLRIKEFELFKERLTQQLQLFTRFQEEKYQSEESQMDDLIIAHLSEQILQDVLDDDQKLLEYFIQYTEELTGTDITESIL